MSKCQYNEEMKGVTSVSKFRITKEVREKRGW